jgi:hypothetical protein
MSRLDRGPQSARGQARLGLRLKWAWVCDERGLEWIVGQFGLRRVRSGVVFDFTKSDLQQLRI